LVITSPPYFGIRDYDLGDNELGHEGTMKEFVDRLIEHLDKYKPLLKEDGTMWVNIGDYIRDYTYQLSPEYLVYGMIQKGWLIQDKLIWLKKNPAFNNAERSVVAHEYIYVFKKNPFAKYSMSWVKMYPELIGVMSYGTIKGRVKLRSVLDFRDGVLETATANNSSVAKACKEQGITFTHNATFPLAVPLAAILTSTDVGDLVVDPFNGSGTSGRAAQILRRKYVGYELNPQYLKQTEMRLLMPMSTDIELEAA
jgi:DNA modification methylase